MAHGHVSYVCGVRIENEFMPRLCANMRVCVMSDETVCWDSAGLEAPYGLRVAHRPRTSPLPSFILSSPSLSLHSHYASLISHLSLLLFAAPLSPPVVSIFFPSLPRSRSARHSLLFFFIPVLWFSLFKLLSPLYEFFSQS